MRKILFFIFALMLCYGVVFAEPIDDKGKVSVLVLPARVYRADADLTKIVDEEIKAKFSPLKYEIQIWGKDSKPEFLEFIEKVKTDNRNQQAASAVIKKDHCIKYGKDTSSSYVVLVYIYPADAKLAVGLFSAKYKFNTQADITAFDVADDKYLWNKQYLTPEKGSAKDGLEWVMKAIKQEFIIPPPIAR